MAKVALKDWKEQIRDPKIECMSRDEMTALQSERLVKQVKNVYDHVEFYRKKMDDIGIEPGDIKGIEDIGKLPFTTKDIKHKMEYMQMQSHQNLPYTSTVFLYYLLTSE